MALRSGLSIKFIHELENLLLYSRMRGSTRGAQNLYLGHRIIG